MGKSELNSSASKTDSSSNRSETHEAMELPICDEVMCSTSEDEPETTDEQVERDRPRQRRGRRGPIGRSMYPMAFIMMMRGGPRGCAGQRRCRSAPRRHGGYCGPAHGSCGPMSGLCRGHPHMKRNFMRHIPDAEFWQRLHEKYAEAGPQSKDSLVADFAKMDVTNDKEQEKENVAAKDKKSSRKCHKRHGRRWDKFMKYIYDEMDLHTATESEQDERNPSDECTTEKSAEKEASMNNKKVHFRDDKQNDEDEMTSQAYLWTFRRFPWERPGMFCESRGLHHGGPWVRPGHFRGMGRYGDPQLMHYGPIKGCGKQRMVHEHPRRWWFRQVMNPASSAGQSTSEDEDKFNKQVNMCEKRRKFRKVIQEMGVQPWMFRSLAYQLYSKKSHVARSEDKVSDDGHEGRKDEKKKYLQTLEELGPHTWMFRVLANQKARAAMRGSDSEAESSQEGAEVEDISCRHRMMQRRQMFNQMAKQMGWTSETSDSEVTDREKKEENKERNKTERQRMRQIRWMPSTMGREYHHHLSPRGTFHTC